MEFKDYYTIMGVGGAIGPLTETSVADWDYTSMCSQKASSSASNVPLAQGANREGTEAAFEKSQPWPDFGRGEHIAGAALFLASDDAEFETGEALIVDGGLTAAGPELSKKFARASARNAKASGVTKGSTGESPALRRL